MQGKGASTVLHEYQRASGARQRSEASLQSRRQAGCTKGSPGSSSESEQASAGCPSICTAPHRRSPHRPKRRASSVIISQDLDTGCEASGSDDAGMGGPRRTRQVHDMHSVLHGRPGPDASGSTAAQHDTSVQFILLHASSSLSISITVHKQHGTAPEDMQDSAHASCLPQPVAPVGTRPAGVYEQTLGSASVCVCWQVRCRRHHARGTHKQWRACSPLASGTDERLVHDGDSRTESLDHPVAGLDLDLDSMGYDLGLDAMLAPCDVDKVLHGFLLMPAQTATQ